MPRSSATRDHVDGVEVLLGLAVEARRAGPRRPAGGRRARRSCRATRPRRGRPSWTPRAPSRGGRACAPAAGTGPSTSRSSAAIDGTLTADVTVPPVSAATTCSAAWKPARSVASLVLAPRWGVTITLSRPNSGDSVTGSVMKTSSAAPPTLPLSSAATRSVFDDQRAAGDVEDADAVLHLRERLGVEPALGLGGLGQVDGDEVGLGVDVVGGLGLGHAELLVALGADERVEGDDVHAEALRALGDELADAAEAEDAERLVEQLGARELAALPLACAQALVRLRDVAGEREQQRERVLGRRHDVRLRRVGDDDPALGGGRDVDVVDADAGAADGLEVGRLARGRRRSAWRRCG